MLSRKHLNLAEQETVRVVNTDNEKVRRIGDCFEIHILH